MILAKKLLQTSICIDTIENIKIVTNNNNSNKMITQQKKHNIEVLRNMILEREGFCIDNLRDESIHLGSLNEAFPNKAFPVGAIHEFISESLESAAASAGFISCLISELTKKKGPCLWILGNRRIFPPALKAYDMQPERILFVRPGSPKEALWILEEALKCSSLSTVVGEIGELDMIASRRLQLAVEKSRVTGFLHRYRPRRLENLACVSRWRIEPLPSSGASDMPGIAYPHWKVQLEKIRNGKPGSWHIGRNVQGLFYSEEKGSHFAPSLNSNSIRFIS